MISLKAKNITKNFGRHLVFREFSYQFETGIYGIAGSNGSGKSTLLKCLAHLLLPNSGTVNWYIDGKTLGIEQFKNELGFAAPYVNLYSKFTARENLEFICQLRHLVFDSDLNSDVNTNPGVNSNRNHYRYWLDQLLVTPLLDIAFGNLSTGQQQRVKLASALIYEPRFLFLDEPGSNLDEQGRGLIEQISNKWNRPGRILFIASNRPEELALCDHIISIDDY